VTVGQNHFAAAVRFGRQTVAVLLMLPCSVSFVTGWWAVSRQDSQHLLAGCMCWQTMCDISSDRLLRKRRIASVYAARCMAFSLTGNAKLLLAWVLYMLRFGSVDRCLVAAAKQHGLIIQQQLAAGHHLCWAL
jgi:hypothetical protein